MEWAKVSGRMALFLEDWGPCLGRRRKKRKVGEEEAARSQASNRPERDVRLHKSNIGEESRSIDVCWGSALCQTEVLGHRWNFRDSGNMNSTAPSFQVKSFNF